MRWPVRAAPVTVGVVVTVATTLLLLAGTLRPGLLLFRDFVLLPDVRLGPAAWGLDGSTPRAVPYDVVMATLSWVLSPEVAQRLVLAAPLLLAGTGVGVLLARRGRGAVAVGALIAVWNPYVAERLGLGQAPTLLAYGALPWLVVAAQGARHRSRRSTFARCTLAFLPAALTPVGAVMALVVLAVAVLRERPGRRVLGAALAGPVALCAPWVCAGLLATTATGEADGARAFAARPEGALRLLGSLATLGGVWDPAAAPASRVGAGGVAGIFLLVVAVTGWAAVRSSANRRLLLVAYAVPVLVASVLAGGPGLDLFAAAQQVPGVSLFRDTHRLLAPAVMAVALTAGCGVQLVVTRLAAVDLGGVDRRLLTLPVVLAALALAVLTVPDLPGQLSRDYRPVQVPADLRAALSLADRSGGTVLSMPWQPLRRTSWNGQRTYLDPTPRGLSQRVLTSGELRVVRERRLLVTDRDHLPQAARWRRGELTTEDLRATGVRWVIEDRTTPGTPVAATPALALVSEGPSTRLWRVLGPPDGSGTAIDRPMVAVMSGAWGLAALALLGVAWCGLARGRTTRTALLRR